MFKYCLRLHDSQRSFDIVFDTLLEHIQSYSSLVEEN